MYNIDKLYNNSNKSFIWLMRQAGRYLPEYREKRKEVGNFLDLCYNPEFAAEVTLQPISRFNFDAAIIFSDILVILDALDQEVEFVPGKGPVIKANLSKLLNLTDDNVREKITEKLNPVYEAIKITRKNLSREKSLIGFTGAYWTLLAYLIEGSGSKTFHKAKIFTYDNQEEEQKIRHILCLAISTHLKNQIKAGCDVIKIFDSWAGILTNEQIKNLVIKPYKNILDSIKAEPAKKICFPRGIKENYHEFCKLNFDIYALDYTENINIAENLYKKYGKITQGNLDPAILQLNNLEKLGEEISIILTATKNIPHIFNLGHGIMPETPIKNVEFMLEKVRSFT